MAPNMHSRKSNNIGIFMGLHERRKYGLFSYNKILLWSIVKQMKTNENWVGARRFTWK